MTKDKIKSILRETFVPVTKESSEENSPKSKVSDKAKDKTYEVDYSEVQRKLEKTMLKASQVMAAAGLGDPNDATDRSLFSKKVRQETNDEGGTYRFDETELAAIIKVLNNPAAYLNVKNNTK